ncbi:MAG: hypothetical protein E7017_07820 [Alphaproteobacteria bacterium]|nr:hypothetical protein [Alphaproteobacteria bacterium]
MKTTFKKVVSLALVICTVCVLALTSCGGNSGSGNDKAEAGRNDFIESIGGTSETYKGSVSEISYESADEAINAYVENEAAGKNGTVQNVDAVSKGELNDAEVKALEIPADMQEGITSVEKFEVTYTLAAEEVSSVAASSNSGTKVIIYIIRYGKEWRYYTPCPVNGETITKSYYDSIFDTELYDNCTFVNESKAEVTQDGVTYNITIKQTIKRDGDNIFFEQVVSGSQELITSQGIKQTYLAAYITMEDDVKTTYVQTTANGSWTKGYLSQSVDPFSSQQYLDYSYFSKTDFGFALKDDNAQRFYKETINSNPMLSKFLDDAKLDLYAEYYVKEGALSGMRMEYSADITGTLYNTQFHSVTVGENIMSCTNYGTTVVQKPF